MLEQSSFFLKLLPILATGSGFFNIGEADAIINLIGRDRSTRKVIQQLSGQAKPKCFGTVDDQQLGKLTGTLEVVSSQPIIGERHSHYQGGKTAIGQLAQVTEGRKPALTAIYFPQIAAGGWGDWVIITNVSSHAKANLNALARDINGNFSLEWDESIGTLSVLDCSGRRYRRQKRGCFT